MASRKARSSVEAHAIAASRAIDVLARAMRKAGACEYEHPDVGRLVLAPEKVEAATKAGQTMSGPRPRPESPEQILFGATEGLSYPDEQP